MRDALNATEINEIAGLVAGLLLLGRSSDEARAEIEVAFPDINPAWLEVNWASLERRAARATPRRFQTPEEVAADVAEGRRLDAMFARRRPLPSAEEVVGFTCKRSTGR